MNIKLKKLKEGAIIPQYASEQAAGMDLSACIDENVTIVAQGRAIIPTGIAIALPPGYEAQVRGRSGLAAKHGILPANGVGTIDADYRGEIGVILLNSSSDDFVVEPGMRIAQLVIAKHETAELDIVDELDETVRGAGGYGSTGR
jgi:dUTP pyrophosphatase